MFLFSFLCCCLLAVYGDEDDIVLIFFQVTTYTVIIIHSNIRLPSISISEPSYYSSRLPPPKAESKNNMMKKHWASNAWNIRKHAWRVWCSVNCSFCLLICSNCLQLPFFVISLLTASTFLDILFKLEIAPK